MIKMCMCVKRQVHFIYRMTNFGIIDKIIMLSSLCCFRMFCVLCVTARRYCVTYSVASIGIAGFSWLRGLFFRWVGRSAVTQRRRHIGATPTRQLKRRLRLCMKMSGGLLIIKCLCFGMQMRIWCWLEQALVSGKLKMPLFSFAGGLAVFRYNACLKPIE